MESEFEVFSFMFLFLYLMPVSSIGSSPKIIILKVIFKMLKYNDFDI